MCVHLEKACQIYYSDEVNRKSLLLLFFNNVKVIFLKRCLGFTKKIAFSACKFKKQTIKCLEWSKTIEHAKIFYEVFARVSKKNLENWRKNTCFLDFSLLFSCYGQKISETFN